MNLASDYYLQQVGGTLEGSTSPSSGFSALSWPVTFTNVTSSTWTVLLQTALTLTSTTIYWIVANSGTGSLVFDGGPTLSR